MDAQAQDRCHRIGQTRDVHIYRLEIASVTLDNNTNTQDDIYSTVYMVPAICKSSLWVIWTKVSQRQVAANS